MLTAIGADRSRYSMLVDEARRLMRDGREFKLFHVARECNGVSHYLANNVGRVQERTVVWLASGPGDVPSLCTKDRFNG